MKKVMFGFCFLLGSAVATYAQDTTSTSKSREQYSGTQQDKQQKDEYSD